jgi:type IV pilus assembly protein PilF
MSAKRVAANPTMTPLHRTCALAVLAAAFALGGCASPPPAATTARQPDPLPPPVKLQEATPKERAKLHADLGAGYYERGRMDVALEELNEAVKLDPNDARIYNLFGLVYAMLAENAKAEQNFQRALAMAPQNPEIRHNWGWYLCSNGQPRESIPEFEMALRDPLYKTPEVALINAGRCSIAFGDLAGADNFFRRAQAAAPSNPGAIYGLSLVAFKQGRQDEARTWIRRLTQQSPVPPEALYLGMCIEKKSGDRSAEQSYVSQLKNRYPDSAETKAIPTGICE